MSRLDPLAVAALVAYVAAGAGGLDWLLTNYPDFALPAAPLLVVAWVTIPYLILGRNP